VPTFAWCPCCISPSTLWFSPGIQRRFPSSIPTLRDR
jgi:hypothetical protein